MFIFFYFSRLLLLAGHCHLCMECHLKPRLHSYSLHSYSPLKSDFTHCKKPTIHLSSQNFKIFSFLRLFSLSYGSYPMGPILWVLSVHDTNQHKDLTVKCNLTSDTFIRPSVFIRSSVLYGTKELRLCHKF